MARDKVLEQDDLIDVLTDLRHEGRRVATTNGCFDVLHVGHLRYLEAAKDVGDILVVLLNSDPSVQRLKGASRPIVPEAERAEMLSGLACVDYVCIFNQDTPVDLLERIRPNTHIKGGDYSAQSLPEAPVLEGMGTEIVFIPLIEGRSTTNLVQRILEVYQPA